MNEQEQWIESMLIRPERVKRAILRHIGVHQLELYRQAYQIDRQLEAVGGCVERLERVPTEAIKRLEQELTALEKQISMMRGDIAERLRHEPQRYAQVAFLVASSDYEQEEGE